MLGHLPTVTTIENEDILALVTANLVNADELLTRIAIVDAETQIAQYNSVDDNVLIHLQSAKNELAEGQELKETDPAAAILSFMHAWEHAQQVALLLE